MTDTVFSLTKARSAPLTAVLSLLLVVETVALHLLLVGRYPIVAWLLTTASVASLVWLWRDYRALGVSAIEVHPGRVEMTIGNRLTAVVSRDRISEVVIPSWRDAKPGSKGNRYVDATAPATPNVRIVFREATDVCILGIIHRPVRYLGLCIDDPDRFKAVLDS